MLEDTWSNRAVLSKYWLLELLSEPTLPWRLSSPQDRDSHDKGAQNFQELFTHHSLDFWRHSNEGMLTVENSWLSLHCRWQDFDNSSVDCTQSVLKMSFLDFMKAFYVIHYINMNLDSCPFYPSPKTDPCDGGMLKFIGCHPSELIPNSLTVW